MFRIKNDGISCYQHFSCNPASQNNSSLEVYETSFQSYFLQSDFQTFAQMIFTKKFWKISQSSNEYASTRVSFQIKLASKFTIKRALHRWAPINIGRVSKITFSRIFVNGCFCWLHTRLQDIFKTLCKDIFKTFWRCIIKLNCSH